MVELIISFKYFQKLLKRYWLTKEVIKDFVVKHQLQVNNNNNGTKN